MGNTTNHAKGEHSPRARFTDAQVSAIKQRLLDGELSSAIAREMGLPHAYIHHIASNKTWKHIDPQLDGVVRTTRVSVNMPDSLFEELKAGDSITTVAKRYGVDESLISREFARREGVGLREYRKQQHDIDSIVLDVLNGMSYATAGREYGLNPRRVARIVESTLGMSAREYRKVTGKRGDA